MCSLFLRAEIFKSVLTFEVVFSVCNYYHSRAPIMNNYDCFLQSYSHLFFRSLISVPIFNPRLLTLHPQVIES